jgi:hypothetical protein
MLESRVNFFRTGAADCCAAAQAARDPAIKQAYLELAHGWRILAEGVELLISQHWQPRIYSGRLLPRRSLDDFFELRSAGGDTRGKKYAIEHPRLGGHGKKAPLGRGHVGTARRRRS